MRFSERGALWVREDRKGDNYMTGKIEINGEEKHIKIFPELKENDKQPDFKIMLQNQD